MARQETALEFWVSACVCLVFATFGEYAFILYKVVKLRRQERNAGQYTQVIQQWVLKRDQKEGRRRALEVGSPDGSKVSALGGDGKKCGSFRGPCGEAWESFFVPVAVSLLRSPVSL